LPTDFDGFSYSSCITPIACSSFSAGAFSGDFAFLVVDFLADGLAIFSSS